MANNTVSNFTLYDELYHTAQLEVLATNLKAFNAASNGAIVMRDRAIIGDYEKHTMFDLPDTIDWRDNTSTSTVSDGYVTDSEHVGVKVNLKYKPFKMTYDAFIKKGMTAQTFSSLMGASNATRKMQYLLGAATGILGSKLVNTAAVKHDVSGLSNPKITADALAAGLSKFGDQAGEIVCWVMHSKVYYDLVRGMIGDNILDVTGMVLRGGSAPTLGRPVIVTDAAAYDEAESSQATNNYWTLGLTRNALVLEQSEPDLVVSDLVTGEQNLAIRVQGEFAINFGMRNCAWDVTNGGRNPNLGALFTHTNWDALFADAKLLPGVVVVSK